MGYVTYNGERFECARAVICSKDCYVKLYDENDNCIVCFNQIDSDKSIDELFTLVGLTWQEPISTLYKMHIDKDGVISNVNEVTKEDITGLGIPGVGFTKVTVDKTSIAAKSENDVISIEAGENVTIEGDNTNKKITLSAKDTVYTHPINHPISMIEGLEDALAEPNKFFVYMKINYYGEILTQPDKTVHEVWDAYTSGKEVVLKIEYENYYYFFPLVRADIKDDITYGRQCIFHGISHNIKCKFRYGLTEKTNGDIVVSSKFEFSYVPIIYSCDISGYSICLNNPNNKADSFSVASGSDTEALSAWARAGGKNTTALSNYSISEGYSSYKASEKITDLSYLTSDDTITSAYGKGIFMLSKGEGAYSTGRNSLAIGKAAHANGFNVVAKGDYANASNYCTIANKYQTAIGKYNKESNGPVSDSDTTGDLFIIGNGEYYDRRSNAFRVTTTGEVYGTGSYNSSGADFAEWYEWVDGNPNEEDRRGLIVMVDGDKIRPANANDKPILGVVSGVPCLVGNSEEEQWHGKYLKDVFGQNLTETVEFPESVEETEEIYIDKETNEEKTRIIKRIIPAHIETRFIINPDYDPEQEYIPRSKRKEWTTVGIVGQVVVVDDGTCQVGGFCAPSVNGIGTASTSGFIVLKRIDDTHIKVCV